MSLTLHLGPDGVTARSDTSAGLIHDATLYDASGAVIGQGSVTMDAAGEFALIGNGQMVTGWYDTTYTWWVAKDGRPHAALLSVRGSTPPLHEGDQLVILAWHPKPPRV